MWALKRTMRVCRASEKVTHPLAVAIGKSKGSCFQVFQNNYTSHVNRTYPPIYGPICNPLLLIQAFEWHPKRLETPLTCTPVRVPVVRLRGLVTSSEIWFACHQTFSDLRVSNGLCEHLRACAQCVYFCKHEQWSIFSCEKLQIASGLHFVNFPPAGISLY